MKIKKSTFYAFRILFRLDKGTDRAVTSKEIAEQEELSQGVILKILGRLGQEGFVYAHQGRGQISGGFSLAKSIDKITVLEIVEALEGVDICVNIDTASCRDKEQMLLICSLMNKEMEKLLSKYTIRNLFESDATESLLDI